MLIEFAIGENQSVMVKNNGSMFFCIQYIIKILANWCAYNRTANADTLKSNFFHVFNFLTHGAFCVFPTFSARMYFWVQYFFSLIPIRNKSYFV